MLDLNVNTAAEGRHEPEDAVHFSRLDMVVGFQRVPWPSITSSKLAIVQSHKESLNKTKDGNDNTGQGEEKATTTFLDREDPTVLYRKFSPHTEVQTTGQYVSTRKPG